MAQALQRAWLRRGALARLLWPLSQLFRALAALRRAAYTGGVLHPERLAVPVIVVGNVVAGGAGKTPVVMALVRHLQQRGLACGVVSRGYGRSSKGCMEVQPGSSAGDVGDEPLLIARSCAVPVFVARRRADAARALLAAHPATQVILCDDGLQHLALARDIEICVFDERGTGNGWLLPAGPLREAWPRAVDLVLQAGAPAGVSGYAIARQLTSHALRADGQRVPLAALQGRPLVALAGIARPQAFFDMLRAHGLQLARTVPLPDHHDFGDEVDLPGGELVCTEKDAVKLWRTRPDAWAVPLSIEVEPAFWQSFDRLLAAKLSSTHGPETA